MNAPLRTLPLLLSLAPLAAAGGGENGVTELVLTGPGGAELTQSVNLADLSPDGRYAVVTTTEALLPEDSNIYRDVYRVDLETDELVLVSVTSSGLQANANCDGGRISADGRFVVFQSTASNLVALDTNGEYDVFRKDLATGTLVRVSTVPGGLAAGNQGSGQADLSLDGRYVAFLSDATDLDAGVLPGSRHVYRRDLQTWELVRLSKGLLGEPDGQSTNPAISGDGSRVAFRSHATNLIWGDTNGHSDIFVVDVGNPPFIVSRPQIGAEANGPSHNVRISDDGAVVAFESDATNLAPGDDNLTMDVYRVVIATGEVDLVSRTLDGTTGDTLSSIDDLSPDGRFVVFGSNVDELTDNPLVYSATHLWDAETETVWLVSRPSGATGVPDSSSYYGRVDADGEHVVFISAASNLVAGDTNLKFDLFRRTLFADPYDYCVTSTTSAGCEPQVETAGLPGASADAGFTVTCGAVPNNSVGVFLYSFAGQAQTPVLGGTLCIGSIAGRSPGLHSGGNPGVDDCSGTFTLDLNAFAAGVYGGAPHPDLQLVGQTVNGQFWGRDLGAASGVFFSEALEYVVGP